MNKNYDARHQKELNSIEDFSKEFIDFKVLEARLPVCRRTLANWVKRGYLPSLKIGRRRLFIWSDVKNALSRRTKGGQL